LDEEIYSGKKTKTPERWKRMREKRETKLIKLNN
jgi:hypothetical protein